MTKNLQNASLLRRIAAILYDLLLVAALWILTTILFIAIRGGEPVAPGNSVYQLALFLVPYVFLVGFWSRKGRTLGMQSWGLQLEDSEGRIPSITACTIRFVVAIVSAVCLGLGFLWQLVDKEKLTWHDRASATRLVYYPKTTAQ